MSRGIDLNIMFQSEKKEKVREFVEGNYRIIYKIKSENHISILTIHHSARDITRREIK